MTNFQKKFSTALATGAVLANAFVPAAFAGTELTISGNGSSSDSTVNVSKSNTTNVAQTNNATVNNNVNVNANTGGNSASDNTGGDVRVRTGDATTDVNVQNMLNSNTADVAKCGGCNDNVNVTISGNGSGSDNNGSVTSTNNVNLFQTNNANVTNDVDVNAKTGNNDVNDNTGGDVTVRTGDVDTTVSLSTAANVNSARIGGANGSNNAGKVSAMIVGNGSNSDNTLNLDFDNDILLAQTNNGTVDNDVDVDAKTGGNDVEDNTGGDVALLTGDADASIIVDNMVNFNAADVEDCCFGDVTAKVSGNGTDSGNDITYSGDNALDVFNTNNANLDNDLDVNGKTGYNDVDDNTGAVDAASDPFVQTGNSDADVTVSNTGGMNTYGNVQLDFDWSDLMDWFHNLSM